MAVKSSHPALRGNAAEKTREGKSPAEIPASTVAKLAIGALVILVLALAYTYFSHPAPTPGFSQLYFTSRPPLAVASGESFDVSFGVSNFEGAGTDYRFMVQADSAQTDAGFVFLSSGANQSFSSKLRFYDKGKHKVNIVLSKIGAKDNRPLQVYFVLDVV